MRADQRTDEDELHRRHLRRLLEHLVQLRILNKVREYTERVLDFGSESGVQHVIGAEPLFELGVGADRLECGKFVHAPDGLGYAAEVTTATTVPFKSFTRQAALFLKMESLKLADEGGTRGVDNLELLRWGKRHTELHSLRIINGTSL